jgi:hypothetical protein
VDKLTSNVIEDVDLTPQNNDVNPTEGAVGGAVGGSVDGARIEHSQHAMMSELTKQMMDMQVTMSNLAQKVASIQVQHTASTPDTSRNSAATQPEPSGDMYLDNGTKMKETTYKRAINGEFINLIDFLGNDDSNEYDTRVTDEGHVQVVPKRHKKQLDTFLIWLQAWNNYEYVIMSVKPQLYNQLLRYRSFIQSSHRKYEWAAVYSYDIRFRAELARTKSWQFGTVLTDIMVSTMDATAVRLDVIRCYRCRSAEHVVQECPFPASFTPGAPKRIPYKSGTAPPNYNYGKEICNNFNRGRCAFQGCKRAHVCQTCRGPRPQIECRCDNNHVAI